MSFILKALKKIENEKAARQAAPVEINSAILAPESGSFSFQRKVLLWLIVPLVLIAGAGTLVFIVYKKSPTVSEISKTIPPSVPPAQTASTLAAKEPQVGNPAKESTRISIKAGQQALHRQRKPDMRVEKDHSQNDAAPASAPEQQASFVAAPPSLTVSGIALQDDPAESMAVVNGVLVKTGMTVGGAVVDRIFLDRVRFKGNGGTFEEYLAK